MSLASILSIAQSGLMASQRQVNTASHNIANASTPGYSRQRVELSAAEPLRTPDGTVGRGVDSGLITRARSTFLDAQFRTENGGFGQQNATKELMGQVEGVLGDLTDSNLATSLDNFYDALGDLAGDPSSVTTRTMARQATADLASQFQSLHERISAVGDTALARMQDATSQVNALTSQIADLNRQIVSARANGSAPDLEDRRDLAIDNLSQLVAVRTVASPDGAVSVLAGGVVLADLAHAESLTVRSVPGGGYGVGLTSGTGVISPQAGELKAIGDFTQTQLPGVLAQLDTLAGAVVARANALHQAGQTQGGVTGVPLFDPAGTTASTIAVSAQVQSSLANLVTGATPAAGDGSVALQLSQLRTEAQAGIGGRTFGEFYAGVASGVATTVSSANDRATAQDALIQQIVTQRSSIQDVSTDEEMITLMKAQQAFGAAAKVITTADQMMQTILQMV